MYQTIQISTNLTGNAQEQAFVALKERLASTPTRAHFDVSRQTKVSSGASLHGHGAVPLQ